MFGRKKREIKRDVHKAYLIRIHMIDTMSDIIVNLVDEVKRLDDEVQRLTKLTQSCPLMNDKKDQSDE